MPSRKKLRVKNYWQRSLHNRGWAKTPDPEYAWIEILANSYKNDRWNRSYTYNQKRTNSPRGEVCPKANISYQ